MTDTERPDPDPASDGTPEDPPQADAADTPETASAESTTDAAAADTGGVPESAEAGAADEVADLKDKLLRALAETENLRRRSQREREDALKFGAANFARDMLSVADNLRRAIDSIPEGGAPDADALKAFVEGVALTEKDLLAALTRHGIEKIEPEGRKFDPQLHEAMFEIPTDDAAPGTVVQVVEAGYVIHGRLLRPAKVGIAKAGVAPTEPGDQVDTTV